MKRQILISLTILLLLGLGTALVVYYGRGYRLINQEGKPNFLGTGLLVTTSDPDGAGVYINDHLTTATDNTINLAPGQYKVRISKEGYFPWEKTVKVEKEVVTKAEATLFPTAPKLENITSSGVKHAVIDPSLTRIAYTVASQSARKNGIYVLDMSSKPILTLQSASSQIATDITDTFSEAQIRWSPDGKDIIATIDSKTAPSTPTHYLLSAGSLNDTPQDITATINSVLAEWDILRQEKEDAIVKNLKAPLRKVITENFTIKARSPDETKILYEASSSASLPVVIKPRLIGVNSTDESRTIEKGSLYVYDIKEDRNYKIDIETPSSESTVEARYSEQFPIIWFPDSRHLIHVHDRKIDVLEYDGKNRTTVYAGPFIDTYVFPWPNGTKLLILTTLGHPALIPNLYTLGLK